MLLPVLASIVIAYLLDDVVEYMEHKGIARSHAVMLVYLIFVTFLVFVIFALVPMLSAQGTELVQQLPIMVKKRKGRPSLDPRTLSLHFRGSG